jgi:glycosyltransferase involved in cell wall biosynthesis
LSEWHVISCEYPPQIGGVGDYVANVAAALGQAGEDVHVWCPASAANGPEPAGVTVHRVLGAFAPRDLRRAGALLDRFTAPRRVLIQWVPHGYGYRSLNLPFCLWARRRARRGDVVDLMVHEPFLAFDGSWRQKAAAAVHRLMTMTILSSARRVWVSTPAWRPLLEPYARGRQLGFDWLPVPSPVEPVNDADGVGALRLRYARSSTCLVGHFGRYSRLTAGPVSAVVTRLLPRLADPVVLLMGEGSDALREDILRTDPRLSMRVHATGVLTLPDLSRHLQACDLVLQPFPEGITSRRTSAIAALAHGRAVVTTEGSASESIWRDRDAVSLVPAGDPDALASAVETLAADPCRRTQLGVRGRQLYSDAFALRHTVDALLAS